MTSKASISMRMALALALTLGQSLVISPLAALADGAVRIAGVTVFENKVATGGMSVDQRAESIQKNLDNALVAAKDRSPTAVSVVYVKGVPVITLGGYQVCTVDADNARLAGVAPAALAQKWSDSLKKALVDRNGVSDYVAQLTGAGSTPAPAVDASGAGPATNVQYAPPAQAAYGGPPMGDQYGRSTGAYPPPGGGYPPQGGGYPPQGGGYPPQGGGYPPQGAGYPPQGGGYSPQGYGAPQRGRVAYAPAGLVISATLNTSIATQAAQAGDMVQATVSQAILLGDAQIPPGATLIGTVTEAKKGGFLGKSGTLGIKFNRLRTPDGVETPISAHIEGGIGKNKENGKGEFAGETWKTKVGQGLIRGGVGAGLGAALGTGVGAIAGGGRGAGRGAWSGTAIGGGVGVLDSLVLRKGKDVDIKSGQNVSIQLDQPVSISVGGPTPYGGAF